MFPKTMFPPTTSKEYNLHICETIEYFVWLGMTSATYYVYGCVNTRRIQYL